MTIDAGKPGLKIATYGASTGFFTPVATPTDFCGMVNTAAVGSGIYLKVVRISISVTQTTAGLNQFFLIGRSTANTGGTPTNLSLVPLDQNNPAGVPGWAVKYAANPSPLGTVTGSATATGIIKAAYVESPTATVLASPIETLLWNDDYEGQPIVLNPGNQGVYLNFNGAAVPAGMVLCVNFLFTRQ
jgi:hypothetical protein